MTGHGIAHHHIRSALALAMLAGATAASAANPVVDRQTPAPVTSISREQLDKLPAGQRIEDLLKTCPAATFPTVTRDTRTPVDGQPISNPFSIRCLAPADIEMIEVYRTHNVARAEYGAPPLARDPLLELSAGDYVGQLARTGKPVHAPRAGRGNIRENISQGLPWWSPRELVGSWVKEKKNFVPGTFPNVSRTGNWFDIGHWAQMIWIRTVVIGCARSAGIGGTWMVCRYGPGGNRDGELVGVPPVRPYLVEAPKLPPTEVFVPKQAAAVRDPEVETKVQPPTLSAADVFGPKVPASGFENTMRRHWDAVMKMADGTPYEKTVSGLMVGYKTYVEGKWSCNQPLELAGKGQVDAALAVLKEMKSQMAETGTFAAADAEEIDTLIEDYESLLQYQASTGASPAAASPATGDGDTKVDQPDLPTKEVFNPADAPQCPLDLM